MARVSFSSEFIFRASPNIVHKFLTSPDCIIRWFCDECRVVDDCYFYSWGTDEQAAFLLDDINEELLRFHWEDSGPDEILEFKFFASDITNETIMILTAWCDEEELKEEKQYWAQQMEALRRATGGA